MIFYYCENSTAFQTLSLIHISSSGDVMTVVVNGQQDIVSIEINPNYLSPENKLLLQDLLCATLNQAITKSRDLNQSAINKLTNDLNLPHIPGLF